MQDRNERAEQTRPGHSTFAEGPTRTSSHSFRFASVSVRASAAGIICSVPGGAPGAASLVAFRPLGETGDTLPSHRVRHLLASFIIERVMYDDAEPEQLALEAVESLEIIEQARA
jgi:hypothetical protein